MKSLYTWVCIFCTVCSAATGDVLIALAMRRIGDLGHIRRQHGLFAVLARVLSSGALRRLGGYYERNGRPVQWAILLVDGLRWPRLRRDSRSSSGDFVPSWCNGTAGFVHLWLIAERVLGDEGYRELAYGAARDALGPMESGVDLCCGLSGRAYALLALHRASGDEFWLGAARKLAFRALRPRILDAPFALSLYKGAVGPVVLAQELREPVTASMPLFESENWPAAEAL